jgi:hypothetical protein
MAAGGALGAEAGSASLGPIGAGLGGAAGTAIGMKMCPDEDKENECHEEYVLKTKHCDVYYTIFGHRWWKQCYQDAWDDYQRCRGH